MAANKKVPTLLRPKPKEPQVDSRYIIGIVIVVVVVAAIAGASFFAF